MPRSSRLFGKVRGKMEIECMRRGSACGDEEYYDPDPFQNSELARAIGWAGKAEQRQ